MRGIKLCTLETHRDARGELVAFEEGSNLAFAPQRFFYIRGGSPDVTRSGHATSAHEVIVILAGAVSVDLDNGDERQTIRLASADGALWIQPGVWVRLRAFAAGTLLLVAASRRYAETRNYDAPQPDLIPDPSVGA